MRLDAAVSTGPSITGPGILWTLNLFGLEIRITQTVITSLVVTLLLCVLALVLGRNLKKRPGRMQVLTEKAVTVITGMVRDAMGEHNVGWTPYISALFLSSLLGSLLGMTGILRSTTADLSTTATWAVMTSAICWYQSIKNTGLKAWLKGFTEPIAIMTPMNLVSEIAQPLSLAFRHFGNIAGGGVITTLIYWALTGASVAVLRLVAANHFAVSAVLLGVGLVLLLLKIKNGKVRIVLRFLGAISAGLGALCLLGKGLERVRLPYPELPAPVYAGVYFGCFALLILGVVLLLWQKKKWMGILGGAVFGLSILGIVYISGGPLNFPILTLGIPAVLSLYFDVFSGVIQAFVFSLLSMIYISGACPPPEERILRGKKKKAALAEKTKTLT